MECPTFFTAGSISILRGRALYAPGVEGKRVLNLLQQVSPNAAQTINLHRLVNGHHRQRRRLRRQESPLLPLPSTTHACLHGCSSFLRCRAATHTLGIFEASSWPCRLDPTSGARSGGPEPESRTPSPRDRAGRPTKRWKGPSYKSDSNYPP